ncbi:MAG: riboflavin synthase [Desulfobacterales bacterium]
MFTGIIEGMGTVRAVQPAGAGARLAVEADFGLEGTRIGDSLCVNGACLTVVRLSGRIVEADVSPETLARTTFGALRPGERVNLERALRLGDRLDGHLVSGHVDGTGRLESRGREGNALRLGFRVPPELTRGMIPKGSVAVDGVSLTINRLERERFEVAVIPHTASWTTLGFKEVGQAVNIETDLIGKYVEQFLRRHRENAGPPPAAGLSLEQLARAGFVR